MNRRMWLVGLVGSLAVCLLMLVGDLMGLGGTSRGGPVSGLIVGLAVGAPFLLSWFWFRDGGWSDRRRNRRPSG